jgi:hypothetical protein
MQAPGSILNQHLAAESFWVQPYPINILAFTLGYTLFGMLDLLNYYQDANGIQYYILNLLSLLLVGGICSLAIGTILNPNKKILIAFSGAVGFLLANTLVEQFFLGFFPNAFASPGSGIYFLIPFIYPILTGSIFGLFIGIANWNWRSLFRYIGIGSLVFFTGYFVNRLSAALMQSFIFHSSLQDIAQTGTGSLFLYLVIPNLLEGLLIGTLFGGLTQRSASVMV